MTSLTYKLVDKEGYILNNICNCGILEEVIENSLVVLDEIDISGYGCIGDNVVICPSEWKYFEKVEDKSSTFTKSDLKDGDIVVTFDGGVYLLLNNVLMSFSGHGFNLLDSYSPDLKITDIRHGVVDEFDIMEVYRIHFTMLNFSYIIGEISKSTPIYKREPELTEEEKERDKVLDDIEKTKKILSDLEAKL